MIKVIYFGNQKINDPKKMKAIIDMQVQQYYT